MARPHNILVHVDEISKVLIAKISLCLYFLYIYIDIMNTDHPIHRFSLLVIRCALTFMHAIIICSNATVHQP